MVYRPDSPGEGLERGLVQVILRNAIGESAAVFPQSSMHYQDIFLLCLRLGFMYNGFAKRALPSKTGRNQTDLGSVCGALDVRARGGEGLPAGQSFVMSLWGAGGAW